MGRKRTKMDKKKIDKLIKEGRGQGKGKEYKPWIDIHSFSSKGIASRIPGLKTGRMHSFMSKLETSYYYILWWSDEVVDIREQYPLLDIEAAWSIAKDLNINYPLEITTKTPIVLTTDFMITVKVKNKEIELARTIKPAKELEKERVIEKLEIERAYFESQGINWGIVTEKEIPEEIVENLNWVYIAFELEKMGNLEIEDLNYFALILKERIERNSESISNLTKELDKEMKLEQGTAMYLFRHLIAKKMIPINIKEKININKPVKLLESSN